MNDVLVLLRKVCILVMTICGWPEFQNLFIHSQIASELELPEFWWVLSVVVWSSGWSNHTSEAETNQGCGVASNFFADELVPAHTLHRPCPPA